jgi:trk system potassium uptake protein TrkA
LTRFAVIGLGSFGMAIAQNLAERGYEVLAIDEDERRVEEAAEVVAQAILLDATDEKALMGVGIDEVDVAVVSIGQNTEASILVTLILKELGVSTVVAKALTPLQGRVLTKVGADRVVYPERDMGIRIAEGLVSPKIFDYIEVSPTHSIIELIAPNQFEGKSIREIDLRKRYGVDLVAIKRKIPELAEDGRAEFREVVLVAPQPQEEIVQGDLLVLLGSYENLGKIKEL